MSDRFDDASRHHLLDPLSNQFGQCEQVKRPDFEAETDQPLSSPGHRSVQTSEPLVVNEPMHIQRQQHMDQPIRYKESVIFDGPVRFESEVHFNRPPSFSKTAHGDEAESLALYRSKNLTDSRDARDESDTSSSSGFPSISTDSSPRFFPQRSAEDVSNSERSPSHVLGGLDGTADRFLKREQRHKSAVAVYIHAGAGFHSHQNETVHLRACNDAAKSAMTLLRAGATATEAVEMALKVLEDKEITNAGYGSNLSLDGVVECDATIVDHFGRSGACGAVPSKQTSYPAARALLAKLILDKSNVPLTLRRVPPNVLVGEGAKLFAEEHSMRTWDNEAIISKNARDRYFRWKEDLRKADLKLDNNAQQRQQGPGAACPNNIPCQQYDTIPIATSSSEQARSGRVHQGDHANAILTGTYNEGQSDSPYHGTPTLEAAHGQFLLSPSAESIGSPSSRAPAVDRDSVSAGSLRAYGHSTKKARFDGAGTWPIDPGDDEDDSPAMDEIHDTVGAIAIDENGHVAAGSSSGGIGMKHRGRLGPAALVGIGTAVVPCHPNDPDQVSVATVTSGTGEHMSTTLASQRCAERIYNNTRRDSSTGKDVIEYDEDKVMESFITQDFMAHPSVMNCHSVGAIGVMTVKKTKDAYYLYFAHNTDSFALASMSSLDEAPQCVMSRLKDMNQVARGARRTRLNR